MPMIPGSLTSAMTYLSSLTSLGPSLDASKIRAQFTKKYPTGPDIGDDELTDIFTAALLAQIKGYEQSTSNAATPEGVLKNIDECIKDLKLTSTDKKKLSDKLCNLRTSQLWDTASELLLARTILQRMPSHRVEVDFPLGSAVKGGQAKDADVAILDHSGAPHLLLDAVTPQPVGSTLSYEQKIVDWVCLKYDSKFSAYCAANPSARVGVIVSLFKNEHFYVGFPMKLVSNQTANIDSPDLHARSGLAFALACSFRCPDGKTLVLDPIANYTRKEQEIK